MRDAEFLRLWVINHIYTPVMALSERTGTEPKEICATLDTFVRFPTNPGWFLPLVEDAIGREKEPTGGEAMYRALGKAAIGRILQADADCDPPHAAMELLREAEPMLALHGHPGWHVMTGCKKCELVATIRLVLGEGGEGE